MNYESYNNFKKNIYIQYFVVAVKNKNSKKTYSCMFASNNKFSTPYSTFFFFYDEDEIKSLNLNK